MYENVCFVVSPIGEPGSVVRIRTNRVFEAIISPAVARLGLNPLRADQIERPGLISIQMLNYLVRSPLVIAEATGNNPNDGGTGAGCRCSLRDRRTSRNRRAIDPDCGVRLQGFRSTSSRFVGSDSIAWMTAHLTTRSTSSPDRPSWSWPTNLRPASRSMLKLVLTTRLSTDSLSTLSSSNTSTRSRPKGRRFSSPIPARTSAAGFLTASAASERDGSAIYWLRPLPTISNPPHPMSRWRSSHGGSSTTAPVRWRLSTWLVADRADRVDGSAGPSCPQQSCRKQFIARTDRR